MAGLVRWGPLWWLSGFRWLAGRTRISDAMSEEVRRAIGEGPCVFVLPEANLADWLSLRAALGARALPAPAWAPGALDRWLAPLSAWTRPRAPADSVEAADRALREDGAICLFADDQRWWWREDTFRRVVDHFADRPELVVVPVTVVWDRSPDVADPVRSFFLAKSGVPGLLRRLWQTLAGERPFLQVGRPLRLGEVVGRVGRDRLAGVLRRMVARAVHVETRTVRGPVLLPWRQLRRIVLDAPPMKQFAREEASRTGATVERVERRMAQEYGRIAASFSWTMIQALHLLLRPLWTRVFRGVSATPEDVERIRTAMRDGTAVLVPSHKSHFDYVLLSWFLYDQGMIVPHVAAGMNLAIWPVDRVLRGAGGFFLRRSFKGEPLFAKVFERYLRELVLREYPVEFFPEGGRTRSGKLLPPKLGLVGMVLEAAEYRAHGREVTFLPISFMYEQVAEEQAMARELGGEKKRAESMGELVRARSVLGRRFGRVFLRVGEPIACGPLVDAGPELPALSQRAEPDRRALVRRVGERIVHRIGRVTVALPSGVVSLALLAVPRRGVRHAELVERVRRFHAFLTAEGCPTSPAFSSFDEAVLGVLDRFVRDGHLEPLGTADERVWQVLPEHRLLLDFAKNQILHWFAPAGLAACALRTQPDGPIAADALIGPFEALRALWRREFVWDPDAEPGSFLAEGLAQLRRHGAIDGDHQVLDPVRIGEIYGLFRSLLEGYLAVLSAGAYLPDDRLAESLRADHAARVAAPWLTRPESLSLVTLQNAVATLTEDGALSPTTGLSADAAVPRSLLLPMTE
jgi:glycerol-3-phosphate O-acyltransferase